MSPKLWPLPLNPFRRQKRKEKIPSFFFKYFFRTSDRGDNTDDSIYFFKNQGMLSSLYEKNDFLEGGGGGRPLPERGNVLWYKKSIFFNALL